jgi:hypothetical protein
VTAAATNSPARPTPVAHPTAVLTLVLATYLMIIVDTLTVRLDPHVLNCTDDTLSRILSPAVTDQAGIIPNRPT